MVSFKTDNGGLAFACPDAKLSVGSSTWATRLSQLGKMTGPVCILTGQLKNVDYIARIFEKRPRDIWIVAHETAYAEAEALMHRFPDIRISLHRKINAKLVTAAPETVWVCSADFGESDCIEAGIGLHSSAAYAHAVNNVFKRVWETGRQLSSRS